MPVCETFDPTCYGCQLRAKDLTVPDVVLPSRRHTSSRVPSPEKQFEMDAKSYRAMRAQGLQPRQVNGSHAIEAQSKTAEQVEQAVPRRTTYADRP